METEKIDQTKREIVESSFSAGNEETIEAVPDTRFMRIHMEPSKRISILTMTGVLSGAVAGGYLGGRFASWQYLAERSHNLPTTVSGWYYYHKWKNYRVILGAFKKASYYGLRIGAVVGMYEVAEAAIDRHVIGHTSAVGSVTSGFGVSLLCASVSRLPRSSFARLVKMGTLGGLCIGVFQDAVDWYEYNRFPFYLQPIKSLFDNK
ncbi:hypothetical protein AYI69_g10953 [Smittium culicis]|uniref:Uncharacterized protein n=1 Tax=Smittium culicis TaxID=133412 RepID=A0A1R1X2A4_9FUNG|nr:hypothetical protein AYI69_g10953 [Smittium culicis]